MWHTNVHINSKVFVHIQTNIILILKKTPYATIQRRIWKMLRTLSFQLTRLASQPICNTGKMQCETARVAADKLSFPLLWVTQITRWCDVRHPGCSWNVYCSVCHTFRTAHLSDGLALIDKSLPLPKHLINFFMFVYQFSLIVRKIYKFYLYFGMLKFY